MTPHCKVVDRVALLEERAIAPEPILQTAVIPGAIRFFTASFLLAASVAVAAPVPAIRALALIAMGCSAAGLALQELALHDDEGRADPMMAEPAEPDVVLGCA